MSTPQLDAGRVSKREFVQRAARRGGIPHATMQKAYDSIVAELLDLVGKGNRVTLTGFGRFYPQPHKGHTVQTKIRKDKQGPGETKQVEDYVVLKFSATRGVNKGIKPEDD